MDSKSDVVELLDRELVKLSEPGKDFDSLMESIGESSYVLIGEASHGTSEFYGTRAHLTRRLIEEKGFHAVAIEGDWPDTWQMNSWVKNRLPAEEKDPLDKYKRFPIWMWRNREVMDFAQWLRQWNSNKSEAEKVGVYGMDLYSLYTSIEAVLKYLHKVDPESEKRASERYACFDHFGEDSHEYARKTGIGLSESCEKEVVDQLLDLQLQSAEILRRDGILAEEEHFFAEQNARVVRNAEQYYRRMFAGQVESWNLRDKHMTDTLDMIEEHISTRQKQPKIVVWAHNSHLGDARATQMSKEGEWNVGQLVRERKGENAYLIGFTTYEGAVVATREWEGQTMIQKVRPALPNSYEELFHDAKHENFMLHFRKEGELRQELLESRLERAIGVIYRPGTERISHYFEASLPAQFDSIIHFDKTSPVSPLFPVKGEMEQLQKKDFPDTFPVSF